MKDSLRLIRINNLLFITIIIGLMEKYVAAPIMLHYQQPEPLLWWVLLLLIAATVLIAAGGYVINDYFDVKIDSINRPDDLVVTRSVSKDGAMHLFYALTGAGMVCGLVLAFLLQSIALGTIFIMVPGLLWFYSASYKRQFIVGNLIVSLLSALTPLLVAFACSAVIRLTYGADTLLGQYWINQIYTWTGGFALFAFLTTWAREVIKDIEDQEGDRELECHTVVVKYGEVAAKIFATVLILLTIASMAWIALSALPIQFSWSNWPCRFLVVLTIGFVGELVLLWSAKVKQDYHHAQLLLKFLMFLGTMFAFCVPQILNQAVLGI